VTDDILEVKNIFLLYLDISKAMKGEHFEVMQYSPAGPLAMAEHAAFPLSGYHEG